MLAYGSLAILMIIDIDATTRRKLLWTALGVVGTFFVNVSRLLAIFLAAYFFEIDTAMYIHIYLGYSLFIVWILVFWTMAFRFMHVPKEKAPE
jgi:exosortase/archaeosortase family protein